MQLAGLIMFLVLVVLSHEIGNSLLAGLSMVLMSSPLIMFLKQAIFTTALTWGVLSMPPKPANLARLLMSAGLFMLLKLANLGGLLQLAGLKPLALAVLLMFLKLASVMQLLMSAGLLMLL